MNKKLGQDAIYDARELGIPRMLLLGLQHLFAMFGATVLVPILVTKYGLPLSIQTTLLFAGGIIYRELKWEDIKFAFAETVRTSGRIFIVIGAAKLYTVMLTTAGFDKWVAKTMLGFSTNPTVILIMILLIFFIVTMFMESIATLTLFMPILYPIALGVGINPIVLSVLITVVIGIGLVTPPVGMCIYVACDLMDTTVGEVFPTLVPFIAATFVCIALMVAFPQLILLPTYLMA